ncbi:hypothetical protein F2Q68_00032240 [Brassica cretica]|uniref:Uncharacterized protein n=1 Tax=Brassica cretica TaxID=69181 RepID=A0A8S9GCR7_BRACR|nr:hypothetical protein F2Q68_00032240 [Brassica cretica]
MYQLSQGNGHVSKPATDRLEYGNRTTDRPSSVATQRPSMHTARSLRSDCYLAGARIRSLRSDRALDVVVYVLGRYVATELSPKLGRYVATRIHAFSPTL